MSHLTAALSRTSSNSSNSSNSTSSTTTEPHTVSDPSSQLPNDPSVHKSKSGIFPDYLTEEGSLPGRGTPGGDKPGGSGNRILDCDVEHVSERESGRA